VSPRDQSLRINDIIQCAVNILTFTEGLDLESFINDGKTIRAVAFELITIGEAVRSLPEEFKQEHPSIPWMNIQGIRNILVHEYFRLDEEILWKTVVDDIPILIQGLKDIQR
jgi:uncharacterized protein with HEPN domain